MSRLTAAQRRNFDRLLAPRQIAFVGGADAIVAITEARRRGFDGDMWAVNPTRETLAGLPCFASLDALPGAPDAVFLAIPARHVVAAVQQLSDMGAGGVVCYAAGFKEAGQGAAEDALRAATGDMALIGPNCYGLINYVDRAALWPFAHGGDCPDGTGAAIITQSGMLSSDITMAQRSLPLAYMISAGNQAVLGIEDFVDLLCDRPAVRAIGLHIEGLSDVPAFARAALRALERGTPIVALKTGRSAIGAALTVSHTGSLAGADTLWQALFQRLGIIEVSSPAQMLETLKLLCVSGAPAGRGVAGFTCSGGGATMLADRAETIGMAFPPFDAQAREDLTALLPDIATVSNPLDYTTPIWGQPARTEPVFARAMARDDVQAAILVQDYPAAGLDEQQIFYRNDALAFARAARARGLPAAICATLPENMDAETRALLVANGVAPLQGLHEALDALHAGAAWHDARERIIGAPPAPLIAGQVPGGDPVDEAAAKAWLRGVGIGVPEGRVVSGGVVDAPRYPVALKMLGPKLLHKTEAGAVQLNLADAPALAAAMREMRRDVSEWDAEAVTGRFLVEEMSPPPLAELVVGVRRDAQFGAALTLGSGGILVELVGDAATLLLPATPDDILRALAGLKVARLLGGFRGRPAADLPGLARRLHQLCAAVLETPSIGEIEINPLFVYERDIVAVDALLWRDGSP